MEANYDLVIVGAGCVGVAAAYYALELEQDGKKLISSVALV